MSKSSDVTRRTAIRVAIGGAARSPRQGAGAMERVQGIGGFFFRAKDPKELAGWYEASLGVTSVPAFAETTSRQRPKRRLMRSLRLLRRLRGIHRVARFQELRTRHRAIALRACSERHKASVWHKEGRVARLAIICC